MLLFTLKKEMSLLRVMEVRTKELSTDFMKMATINLLIKTEFLKFRELMVKQMGTVLWN